MCGEESMGGDGGAVRDFLKHVVRAFFSKKMFFFFQKKDFTRSWMLCSTLSPVKPPRAEADGVRTTRTWRACACARSSPSPVARASTRCSPKHPKDGDQFGKDRV